MYSGRTCAATFRFSGNKSNGSRRALGVFQTLSPKRLCLLQHADLRPASRACFRLLRPQYMPQQRTMDKSFKLRVPKTSSFGPVRRQRSPTQWGPWGSKNVQTRAKSSTLAFCSGSSAPDSSASTATNKGCEASGARSQASAPWHVQTLTIVLTRLRRVLPSEVSTAPLRARALRGRNPARRRGSPDSSHDAVYVASWVLCAQLLCQGPRRQK